MTACVIAPVWPNQVWFPQHLAYLVDHPILLPPIPDIVLGPEGRNHPLAEGATCLWLLGLSLEILLFTGVIGTSYEDHQEVMAILNRISLQQRLETVG